jgi:hypothetical protein
MEYGPVELLAYSNIFASCEFEVLVEFGSMEGIIYEGKVEIKLKRVNDSCRLNQG